MRDEQRTTNEQLKIELLSQWKLEAESRNMKLGSTRSQGQLGQHLGLSFYLLFNGQCPFKGYRRCAQQKSIHVIHDKITKHQWTESTCETIQRQHWIRVFSA